MLLEPMSTPLRFLPSRMFFRFRVWRVHTRGRRLPWDAAPVGRRMRHRQPETMDGIHGHLPKGNALEPPPGNRRQGADETGPSEAALPPRAAHARPQERM